MPYTPKPLKPYIPAPVKEYLPATPKPFLPKADRKEVGRPLNEAQLEVLRAIGEEEGATSTLILARNMEKGLKRVVILCRELAEADYLDLFESGFCRLKPLGKQALEGIRTGLSSSSSKKCPRCSELNRPGRVFCSSCWQYLGAVEEVEPAIHPSSERSTAFQDYFYHSKYHPLGLSDVEFSALRAIGEAGGTIALSRLASLLGIERRKAHLICREGLGSQDYIDVYRSGLIRVKNQGWRKLEEAGYIYPRNNLSIWERQILKLIGERGGELHLKEIAGTLGMPREEVKIYSQALGNRDFIDIFLSGLCRMKAKGWRALEGRKEVSCG